MINGEEILKARYPDLNDDQYQPAGIDLTVGKLYSFEENSLNLYGLFKKIKVLPNYEEILPRNVLMEGSLCKSYTLAPGTGYIVETHEKIDIDPYSAQLYFPRSTLGRSGISLHTSLGDPGFSGHLRYLIVNNTPFPFMLEKGVRFAQLVDFTCTGIKNKYNGDYNEK